MMSEQFGLFASKQTPPPAAAHEASEHAHVATATRAAAPIRQPIALDPEIRLSPSKPGPAGNLASVTISLLMIRHVLFNQTDDLLEIEAYTDHGVFVLCINPENAATLACGLTTAAEKVLSTRRAA